MPSSRQEIHSDYALPEGPSDSRPAPTAMKVTPTTESSEREDLVMEELLDMANQLFGFNGWSSEIRNTNIDFVDSDPDTGRTSLGVSVIVRVTLASGTFHEDIGYGQVTDCSNKGQAFQSAKESAVTDSLRRAIRHFCDNFKQHILNPGSNGENSRSFEPLCSGASPEIEHLQGTRMNGINASRADSAEGEFGSDPFEEIKMGDELDMQVLEQDI